jgi:plasmid stabilization system protein ParE
MREIVISTRVQKKIENLFEYLDVRFSVKTREKFAKKLYSSILTIRKNPESFPSSEQNSKINKCVITKQSTVFYRYNLKQVRILSVFDTRQDPNKIKKIK